MEKLAYVLWRRQGQTPALFREHLRTEAGLGLRSLGAARVQSSVADFGEHEAELRERCGGHEAKFARNVAAMMASVRAFLDPDCTDLMRTSRYLLDEELEPSL